MAEENIAELAESLRDPIVAPPRNPARMPESVENVASAMTVQPVWDVAQGVGAVAQGQWQAPEVGTGIFSGLGMYSPAIFAGIGARTANRVALARAEEMAANGLDRTRIFQDTGWFRGVDGRWRFEIPDNNLWASPGYGEGLHTGRIGHDDLARAYPQLRYNLPHDVQVNPNLQRRGSFNPEPSAETQFFYQDRPAPPHVIVSGPSMAQARSVAGHELQHVVQDIEGFTPGANPVMFESTVRRPGMSQSSVDEATRDLYRRTAGEAEARNVQQRLDITAHERRLIPPWRTGDVPENRQIISGPHGGPQEMFLGSRAATIHHPAANQNTSQVEIREMLPPPPLSLLERNWQNYGRRMTPDEVLASEPIWGGARQMAERSGIPREQAFAELANDMWQRMGANRFITPDIARRYMAVEEARMRGIATVPIESLAILRRYGLLPGATP